MLTVTLLSIGIALVVILALLPVRPHDPVADARDMIGALRKRAAGDIGTFEWDDVMGVAKWDPYLESLRVRADVIVDRHRSFGPNDLFGAAGRKELLEIAEELRRHYSIA